MTEFEMIQKFEKVLIPKRQLTFRCSQRYVRARVFQQF